MGRIARLHQMSVKELKKLNNLQSSIIHPGDQLKVPPLLGRGSERAKLGEIDWDDLMNSLDGVRGIQIETGPYYGWSPQASHQSHDRYFEVAQQSPLQTYKKAKRLLQAFEREVSRLRRLSNTLSNWHIVLDPGHGGLFSEQLFCLGCRRLAPGVPTPEGRPTLGKDTLHCKDPLRPRLHKYILTMGYHSWAMLPFIT